MSTKGISVLVVDDSADMAFMLTTLIDFESDMRSAGTLGSADSLVAVAKRLKPDVIVLDLTMPGHPPLEALRELCGVTPETRVIIFSGYDDRGTVEEAIDAGAWGLVSKHNEPMEVVAAIRRVAQGETCFPAAIATTRGFPT